MTSPAAMATGLGRLPAGLRRQAAQQLSRANSSLVKGIYPSVAAPSPEKFRLRGGICYFVLPGPFLLGEFP